MNQAQIAQELVTRYGKDNLQALSKPNLQALFFLANTIEPSGLGDFYLDGEVLCVPEGQGVWRHVAGQGWVK